MEDEAQDLAGIHAAYGPDCCHEKEDTHNYGLHALRRLVVRVFISRYNREDLRERDEDVDGDLHPSVNRTGLVTLADKLSTGIRLVYEVLQHRTIRHGS